MAVIREITWEKAQMLYNAGRPVLLAAGDPVPGGEDSIVVEKVGRFGVAFDSLVREFRELFGCGPETGCFELCAA